jgi:predicted lipid-binding transport protein (Tim44 family)
MTEPAPSTNSPSEATKAPPAANRNAANNNKATPLRCFTGGLVAGAIAIFFYHSAEVIAGIFAQTQIQADNFIVMRMSSAIRTLVIGMFALGAGVFGMAAIGLSGLGIQILLGKDQPQAD